MLPPAKDRSYACSARGRGLPLVRYVSPFGSPAWMPREDAERRLAEDDARWLKWQAVGRLDERMRAIGPPRIEVHQ